MSSVAIVVPLCATLTGDILVGVLIASSTVPELESEEGEAFANTRADRVAASSMDRNRTVLVPICAPEEGTVVNFAFLHTKESRTRTTVGDNSIRRP